MSDDKAEESQDDIVSEPEVVIEAETVDETEQAAAKDDNDDEEVEIVVEGEEAPPSKPKRASGLQKRFKKLTGKIDAANTEAEEAKRRAQMLEEENKLLRLQAQQSKPAKRPNEDDYDDRQEYLNALDEYQESKIEEIAEKKAEKIVQAAQAQTSNVQVETLLNTRIDEHYQRSDELRVPDYSDAESVAADILGDDAVKQILLNADESHLIMYHLGKNPDKAEKLKSMLTNQPVNGVMEIGRLAASLKVKPKSSIAPDPETKIKPGGGGPLTKNDGPEGATYE